jgi:hypothetical protein
MNINLRTVVSRKYRFLFLLIGYVIFDTLNAYFMMNNPQFDAWFAYSTRDLENPAGALVGTAPLFVLNADVFMGCVWIIFYALFANWFRSKHWNYHFRLILWLVFSLTVMGFCLNVSIDSISEYIQWGLYSSIAMQLYVVALFLLMFLDFYHLLQENR